LLNEARAAVKENKTTLTALIQEGLQLALRRKRSRPARKKVVLPVSKKRGGTWPGIDLNKTSALLDELEFGD
jgi:hypothetical protein